MENINTEKLIMEIEKRPPLWDMRRKDYADRIVRKQCWEEITKMFADDDMTVEEKGKLGEVLHKKWKNIRDNFSRDLQRRKGKSGNAGSKKVPYMYTRQLQFLKDTLIPKDTTNSLQPSSSKAVTNEDDNECQPSTSKLHQFPAAKKRLHPVEEKILSSVERQEKIANMETLEDDNRYFLLSLLPTLASLPRRLNSTCRLEIMQILHKFEGYAEAQNSVTSISNGYQSSHLPQPQQIHLQNQHTLHENSVSRDHHLNGVSEQLSAAPSPTETRE